MEETSSSRFRIQNKHTALPWSQRFDAVQYSCIPLLDIDPPPYIPVHGSFEHEAVHRSPGDYRRPTRCGPAGILHDFRVDEVVVEGELPSLDETTFVSRHPPIHAHHITRTSWKRQLGRVTSGLANAKEAATTKLGAAPAQAGDAYVPDGWMCRMNTWDTHEKETCSCLTRCMDTCHSDTNPRVTASHHSNRIQAKVELSGVRRRTLRASFGGPFRPASRTAVALGAATSSCLPSHPLVSSFSGVFSRRRCRRAFGRPLLQGR